jgi:DNA-binding NtrC family response regulator
MAKVLLVGYIREHLEERRAALQAAAHQTTIAADFTAANQAIDEDTFDVAVLGFSVPEQERNLVARRVIQANPGAKIVMIYFSSVENTELADALIPTTANAQDVLRAVNHVLKANDRSKTG